MALAKKAEAAVNAAKKGVEDAQRKVTDYINKVHSEQGKLDADKVKLTNACNSIFGDELLGQQVVMKILAEQNYDLDVTVPQDDDSAVRMTCLHIHACLQACLCTSVNMSMHMPLQGCFSDCPSVRSIIVPANHSRGRMLSNCPLDSIYSRTISEARNGPNPGQLRPSCHLFVNPHVSMQDEDLAYRNPHSEDHSVLMSMVSEYETLDQVPDCAPSRSRSMSDEEIEQFAEEQVQSIQVAGQSSLWHTAGSQSSP